LWYRGLIFGWFVGFAVLYFAVCGDRPPREEPRPAQAAIYSIVCTVVAAVLALLVGKVLDFSLWLSWLSGAAVAYYLFYRLIRPGEQLPK